MAYITQTHYYRYFKNHLFSQTGCFFIYVILFALLFPFLFAVSTGGINYKIDQEFWYDVKYDFKQPQITPTGQYSLQCQDAQNIETYSNIANISRYKDELGLFTDSVDYQYQLIDSNKDGYPDKIQFNILKQNSFASYQCTLLLLFYVGIRSQFRLQMISPIVLNFNEDFSNYRVYIDGQLKFYQKNALPSSAQTRKIYNNTDYYFEDQLHQLQKHVLNMNETLTVKYDKYLFKKAVDNRVIIEGQLSIPVLQDIGFKPTIMVNFKEIWIQYIFIAIPTFYLLNMLLIYAFKRKIFFTHFSQDNERIQL
ncbi:hypothetical protein pb186bvf_019257 [Paramecium bursaria]